MLKFALADAWKLSEVKVCDMMSWFWVLEEGGRVCYQNMLVLRGWENLMAGICVVDRKSYCLAGRYLSWIWLVKAVSDSHSSFLVERSNI